MWSLFLIGCTLTPSDELWLRFQPADGPGAEANILGVWSDGAFLLRAAGTVGDAHPPAELWREGAQAPIPTPGEGNQWWAADGALLAYVFPAGGQEGSLFRSTDRGASWVDITPKALHGLPPAARSDPDGNLLIAHHDANIDAWRVWSSASEGASWRSATVSGVPRGNVDAWLYGTVVVYTPEGIYSWEAPGGRVKRHEALAARPEVFGGGTAVLESRHHWPQEVDVARRDDLRLVWTRDWYPSFGRMAWSVVRELGLPEGASPSRALLDEEAHLWLEIGEDWHRSEEPLDGRHDERAAVLVGPGCERRTWPNTEDAEAAWERVGDAEPPTVVNGTTTSLRIFSTSGREWTEQTHAGPLAPGERLPLARSWGALHLIEDLDGRCLGLHRGADHAGAELRVD